MCFKLMIHTTKKLECIKDYNSIVSKLFILQLVETFQSIMQFCDPKIPESCRKLFDHFSSLEMHHVANQFEEFKQLTSEIQVGNFKSFCVRLRQIDILSYQLMKVIKCNYSFDRLLY